MRTVIILLFFVLQGCRNKIDKISGFWREKDNSSSYEFLKNGSMVQHFVYEERNIYRINEEGEYQEPVIIDRECKYTIKGDSIFLDFPKFKLPAKLSQNWGAFLYESNFKGKIYSLMDNGIEFKGILNVNGQNSEIIYDWVKGNIELKDYRSIEKKKKYNNDAPSIFTYEGNAIDEIGNKAHYILKIKSDFSAASIAGGPYSKLEHLSKNIYQWIEGSIIGIKIRIDENSCTLYNLDGSYFCTLYKSSDY